MEIGREVKILFVCREREREKEIAIER